MNRHLAWLAGLWLTLPFGLPAAENPYGLPDGLYAEITTPRGIVVCELFFQKTPITVAHYVGLAEGTLGPEPGKPYYDGLKWHRVVRDFVVQGGAGARLGHQFPDELVPGLRHDSAGVLQMANSGPDSNGSQYCLMLSPQQRLNYLHTVFGHAVRGLEVLPKIEQGDTMQVKILRLGAAARAFRADPAAFDQLVAKAKRYAGPREPGPDAPFDDPDKVLPTEWDRAKTFNFKLANFERFTGRRIAARVFAKAPPAAAGDKLDEYLRREAERLRVARAGALAVYLADQDRWHLRIGDDSAATFAQRSYLGARLPAARPLAESVAEFLAEAKQHAAEFIATAEQQSSSPVAPAQKLKLSVDAVLDGLIFKLEPSTESKSP